ncbi:MAG: SDR family NAD(P)-dependent oxidoreductase [Bryobacteraceae bacterium]
MFDLTGKRAVITGGGSGIGQAIAETFARQGAESIILDANGDAAAEAARSIRNSGEKASSHVCDVSSRASVSEAFGQVIANGGVDILVNNAGVSHIGDVETTTEDDFVRLFDVNVKGYFNCLQASIGHMKEKRRGVIVNMASTAAVAGIGNRFAYSMSKGAVLAMTYSVAKDYLPWNIRCNAISPARVHTPFVDGYIRKNYPGQEKEMFETLSKTQPIGRMGEPKEVAAVALFLCSDEAAYVTGNNYAVDGGALRLSI